MGVDIHVYLEVKNDNEWINLSLSPNYHKYKPPFEDLTDYNVISGILGNRDYYLFDYLCGSSRYIDSGIEIIAPLRGLPKDVSEEVKKEYDEYANAWFGTTWYDFRELELFVQTKQAICIDEDGKKYNPVKVWFNKIVDILSGFGIYYPAINEVRVIVWFDC